MGPKGVVLIVIKSLSIEPLTYGYLQDIPALFFDLEPVAMPGFATTPCDIAVMVIDPYLYKLYEDKKIYLVITNMRNY
jgi:hypothetical protein